MNSTGKEPANRIVQWLTQLVAFILLAAFSVLAFRGLDLLLAALFPAGEPHLWVHLTAVLLLGLFMMLFYTLALRPLRTLPFVKRVSSRPLIPQLRDEISQCRDTEDLASRILTIVQHEFGITDAQLTFYYDQPFALEVTHLRRVGDAMQRVIARVREDEPEAQSEEEEVLTPLTAEHTEVLTHRDRLVGLLLLGSKRRGRGFNTVELERLSELSPVVAAGADQVMMIRHINETNQRLFESDKLISIGQLASGIAHEIRNPLTSMRMNLQGLKRRAKLAEKDTQRVQICLDELGRLDDIVREIMQFARRTQLEVHPMKAKSLVNKAVDTVRSEVEERGIEIVVRIAQGVPEIRADENRLIRSLINLIMNAAQAMGHGGEITILAEPYGTGIEIQVVDQGPGIPPELHRDVFNPFFTTKADGTGLGLANALKFVQEHGGELDFTSEMGNGTVFSMRLPPSPPAHLDDPSALRVVPT